MALRAAYSTGTVSVAANGTTVTGDGTMFAAAGVRTGDIFAIDGLSISIASVDSSTELTLAEPWPGGAKTDAAYEIRYIGDPARVLNFSREAISRMEELQGDIYSSVDFYSSVAAGIAATTEGQQFQVISGDDIVRYSHGSGGSAVELTRLPSSAALVDLQAAVDAAASSTDLAAETAAREDAIAAEAAARAEGDNGKLAAASTFTDGTLLAFTTEQDGSVLFGIDQEGNRFRGKLGGEEIVTTPDLDDAVEELLGEADLAHTRLDADIQARGQNVLGGRLDPDYVWALTTKFDGSILMGLRADGRLVYDQRAPGYDAVAMAGKGYVIQPDDSLSGFTYGDPENPINISDLPVKDARIEQGYVRVVSERREQWLTKSTMPEPVRVAEAGAPLVTRLPITSAPFVNHGITKVYAVVNYGQSFASFSLPTLTVDPVAPGKALMFSAARNAPKLTTWGLTTPDDWDWANGPYGFEQDLSMIGDLYSREGETPTPGMASHLLRSLQSVPNTAALFMINLANGGVDHKNLVWPINQDLSPADQSSAATVSQWNGYRFSQIVRALKVLRYQCGLHGLDLEVRAITYMHGEADVALGAGYQAYLEHLQGGFTDHISYITGQTYDVPVICDQADWRKAPSLPGATSWAQLQAAIDNPGKIICAGPHYWVPRLDSEGSTDGLHPTAAGRRMLGHNYGRAMNKLWATGGYVPLHVSAATRSSTTVNLTFSGNEGALVIDTTNVSAAPDGHHGITWHQEGGNSPTVVSATITGTNTMQVTLDVEPSGYTKTAIHVASNVGDRLPADPLYAHYGPVNGPRSNIRDSSATFGHDTMPLYNWACHQEFELI